MLTLVPEGGLCNRMRVVASAASLCRQAGVPLHLLWYRTPDFNCSFHRLFAPLGAGCRIDERVALGRLARLQVRVVERTNRLRGWQVLTSAHFKAAGFSLPAFAEGMNGRNSFLRSHDKLIDVAGMFDIFAPVGEVALRLSDLKQRTVGAIGVHIRRADNVKAIDASPTSGFIAAMESAVERDPSVTFFLASDDEGDVATLRTRFGSRVFVYEKRSFRRDDPVAIEDAAVDLFGLSSCRRLIGSYWSSFTDTAAELGRIDCQVIRSVPRVDEVPQPASA